MQTVLVIILLLASVGYLSREFYKRFLSKESKCDGCAVSQITDPRN